MLGFNGQKTVICRSLVDYNAGTKVSDVKLRSIPLLRGDVAAYVRTHASASRPTQDCAAPQSPRIKNEIINDI